MIRVLALLTFCCVSHIYAVTIGQTDTFEDGTTQGWLVNLLGMGGSNPVPPTNQPSGGPAGADDNFLLLQSTGQLNAPGGRLVALNPAQWSGNYLAAGISGVRMDLRNLGSTDLSIRLLLERVGPMGPTDIASTDAVLLPAGGDWTSAAFSLLPGDLNSVLGSVENALSEAAVLRIFHNPDEGFPGPDIAAQLGVDNITAIPEPSSLVLAGLGAALLCLRRRRVQQRQASRL